jgi:hypothetical protein
MQILYAKSSLTGVNGTRQNAHTSAKRGNFVKVVVEGGIQFRTGEGKYSKKIPASSPVCWVPIDQVLSIKDLRRPRGRPLKVTEVAGNRVIESEVSVANG